MSRRRPQDLQSLFHAALERRAEERAGFLLESCGDDDALRTRLEALLTAHDEAGSFLEGPALLNAAESMAGSPGGTAGRRRSPSGAPEIGGTLSHFRILAKIGEGGMGEVYLAEDSRLKRKVALKTLPAEMIGDPGWRRRFQREAETLAALNHPNIVTIYSIERSGATRFLTMEFVEGRSLDRILRPGGLDLPELLEIGSALAEALTAAHEKGIVHRDLKPANVMQGDDGRVKVLDFGLAKALETARGPVAPSTRSLGDTLSLTGAVMGTARYMSPEHFDGGPLDGRSDIFSLGIVLYELATGERPFSGEDAVALRSSMRRDTPPAVHELRPRLPDRLGHLIARCLEKDPERRFQSARDVREELAELRRAMAPGPRAHPPRWRVRAAVAVAAIIVTAAVAWLALPSRTGSPFSGNSARGDATLAVLPFADMSQEKNLEYFADGMAEELLNTLSKNPGLRVAARTSSFYFKDRNLELAEIGRQLNVATILEGSVRKAGDRVRITVQLVKAADGYHLWSETYDRPLEDIFAVQDEIAGSVAAALHVALPGRQEDTPIAHAMNTQAYSDYLQGRYFFERQSAGSLEQSIERFQAALRLEPTFSPAWIWLSAAYCGQADQGYVTVEDGYSRCRQAAERAIALDDTRGQAHANVGWIAMNHDWDWERADAAYRRAWAMEPGNAHVAWHCALFALSQGRLDEAMALALRATELEPISTITQSALAFVASRAGRMDEAKRAAEKALELNLGMSGAQANLGLIHLLMGRDDQALLDMEREARVADRLQGMALAYHTLGRRRSADAALRELIETSGDTAAYLIAEAYAHRGEIDSAFTWLDRAYEAKAPGLPWIRTDPLLENLEQDPRYRPFLDRIRLAE